jgi:hypothetical protein
MFCWESFQREIHLLRPSSAAGAPPSQPPRKGRPVTWWQKKIALLPNEKEIALLPNRFICTLK